MNTSRQPPQVPPADWDLGDWERALTIRVGTAYVCRRCENIVMVTRGGVGVMELICCGRPMEQVAPGGVKGGER